MSARVEALANPKLLIWARESAGYDLHSAAGKLTVEAERLESWESGKSKPTIVQLRKLGNIYKRPIAIFYLPEPPKDFAPIRDYRRLPGRIAGIQSPPLHFEIRKAYSRREITLELYEGLEITPKKFSLRAHINEDPEKYSHLIREALGIKLEDQIEWRPGYDALHHWSGAIENIDVLVFQTTDVETKEIRGFSISETPLPVIVVNISDAPQARIFTVLHELTHIMLREGGLCDLDEEAKRRPEEQRVEVFCNRVAGAALVPQEFLMQEDLVKEKSHGSRWSDEEIKLLSDRYAVSRDVMLRRLLICDRITKSFYQEKFEKLQKEYARKKEEYEEKKRSAKAGFPPPYRVALSSTGRLFAHLVLDNYHQNKITASDVSEYLGVRLKHLEKIEGEIFAASRRHGGGAI